MSFVEVEKLNKCFNNHIVLNNIGLTIEKGEFITLLGPSGCGKSTLLRCIAGLNSPDQGIIKIDGQDVTHLEPKAREVGMVFQSYALFPNMTVYDNIAFGLKMKKIKDSEIAARVNKIIELVDLTGKIRSYPHQLSGGQQQRVALARSLVIEPKVLLLDEPLSALDAKIRKNLQAELRNIQQELHMTMVLVTHDQEEALTVSDRIFVMDHGNIVQIGEPEDIYTSPANEFVARFIGNYNVLNINEFRKLTGDDGFPSTAFAIRPEVIQILPGEINNTSPETGEGWLLKGIITEATVKGSILRYQIKINETIIQVDRLNIPSQHRIQRGMTVNLWIPRRECIVLQAS